MTKDESIKYLNGIIGDGSGAFVMTPISVDALKTLIEAVRKSDKYRWHDLRKNPEELPNAVHRDYVQVEIITKHYKIPQYCEYGFVDGFGYYFLGFPQEDIIAWRYLELFEEEE